MLFLLFFFFDVFYFVVFFFLFCFEDNIVFIEFWRIKGKCCIREMYSRISGGVIYVFIEKKYLD